jgi:hypothetical protein
LVFDIILALLTSVVIIDSEVGEREGDTKGEVANSEGTGF